MNKVSSKSIVFFIIAYLICSAAQSSEGTLTNGLATLSVKINGLPALGTSSCKNFAYFCTLFLSSTTHIPQEIEITNNSKTTALGVKPNLPPKLTNAGVSYSPLSGCDISSNGGTCILEFQANITLIDLIPPTEVEIQGTNTAPLKISIGVDV